MTKPGDKDWLPYAEHVKLLPKKRIASAVLFLNSEGNVLMVKPTYKPSWILPGGVTELNESPLEGARREVKEETGLTVSHLQFVAAIHTPRKKENDDVIHFYFYGGVLSNEQASQITLQADELLEYAFVRPDEVSEISTASFVSHLSKMLVAIKTKSAIFVENRES